MQIWEIAVLLGHAHELDSPEDQHRRAAGTPRSDRAGAAAARNRARLAASRGDGPAPEAEPLDPAAFQQLAGALS